MGVDIHIRVTKYNEKTNLYEELVLYMRGEEYHYDNEGNKVIDNPDFKRIPVYEGRNSEMFEGMLHGDEKDGYGDFPSFVIAFNSLEPKLRADIEEKKKIAGYYDFYELTLADMAFYLTKHGLVTDYNADWDDYETGKAPKPLKVNPIKYLFDDICKYIEFAEGGWSNYYNELSRYKIIYYFDC